MPSPGGVRGDKLPISQVCDGELSGLEVACDLDEIALE